MKRILCAGLTLALALALACPALAEGPDETSTGADPYHIEDDVTPPANDVPPLADDVTVPDVTPPAEDVTPPDGTAEIPPETDLLPPEAAFSERVIHVEAPTSARVIINPYHIKVQLGDAESDSPIVGGNEILRNYSPFPVRVEATAIGTAPYGSGAVFTLEPPTMHTKEKAVFLYLEFQNVWSVYDQPSWNGAYWDLENQVCVNGPGKWNVLTLDAGTEDTPGCGMFRLFGETAPAPAVQWTTADTVDVTVFFTFAEAESAEPAYLPEWA